MAQDLMRFSVAMPEELLMRFDQLVARRGLAKNRSEVVRDLVRDALVEDECATPGVEVVGTLTIAFDHHASDLQESCIASSILISTTSSRRCTSTSTSTTASR